MSPILVPIKLWSHSQLASVSEYSFQILSAPLPPIPSQEVLSCLSELGDPWLQDIRVRLGDPPENGRNIFCVGREGSGQIVSNTWIGWNGQLPEGERVGLLGHVFTLPTHRQRGLATRVVSQAMEQFYKEGGLCLLLGVANQSARRMYHKLGFREVRGSLEDGHIMLHSKHSTAPDAFLGWYFSGTGPVTSQLTTRQNIGDISLLFLAAGILPVRDELLKLGDPLSAELDALNLFLLLDGGRVTSRIVLLGPRVAGLEIEHSHVKYSIYSNSLNPKH